MVDPHLIFSHSLCGILSVQATSEGDDDDDDEPTSHVHLFPLSSPLAPLASLALLASSFTLPPSLHLRPSSPRLSSSCSRSLLWERERERERGSVIMTPNDPFARVKQTL